MGAGAGFDLLAQANVQRRQADYEDKQRARDLQFQNNFDQLQNDEKNIQLKYSSTLDKAGKPTADSQQWVDALAKNHADQRQLYDQFIHPATNPGAIQRLGGWIAKRVGLEKPAPSITTEVGAITIPGAAPTPLNPYTNPEAQPPAESLSLNKQWAKTGSYTTKLSPEEEAKFQQWAKDNKIPWQDSATADYDMRGYWKALTDPNDPNHALASRAPNGHFPDMWKTPYSGVFSRESMYAMPGAPEWKGDALYTADGRLVVGAPQSAAEGTNAQGTATPSLGAGPAVSLPGQKVTITEVPQKQFDKQQALEAKNAAEDQAAAQEAIAGAPISPQQAAVVEAQAQDAAKMAAVESAMEHFHTLFPDASAEERAAYESQLVRSVFGLDTGLRPMSGEQPYKGTDGRYYRDMYDPKSGTIVAQAMPPDYVPTKTADVNMDQYHQAVADGYKGSFVQWSAEQHAAGTASAPRPRTAEQIFESIETKRALGETITPQEEAQEKAIKAWNQFRFTDPRIAGYQALVWSRLVAVEVPGKPGELQYVPAGQAYKTGAKASGSLSHLMSIYYGTGKGSQDLLRFNTATHHLQLMRQVGEALQNGNVLQFNRLKNAWETQIGGSAPTNFNGIRDAVAGELSRLYTGVGATEQEIGNVEQTVNAAQSPEQLNGIIDTDLALMKGKIQASAQQFLMGEQGMPAFPSDVVPEAPENAPPEGGGAELPRGWKH